MPEYAKGAANLFLEELKKWFIKLIFLVLTAILAFIFTPLYEKIQEIWEMPERLNSIESSVKNLEETTKTLTGEDRIIRQPYGLSYVREPVKVGDNINVVIVAQRTESGLSCILEGVQGVFSDETRIPYSGSLAKYTRLRNIGKDLEPVSLELVPPPNLIPGRIEIYLVSKYDCDGSTRFDRTYVLNYKLLSEEEDL